MKLNNVNYKNMINNNIKIKSQEQLYKEAIGPFIWGVLFFILTIIIFIIMRIMWIGGVLLVLPFFVFLFSGICFFSYSLILSLNNFSFIIDTKLKNKLRKILIFNFIFGVPLLIFLIILLYSLVGGLD